jgi:hypothetical protein
VKNQMPVALDCPECGRIRWSDEDGCCSMCGSACSWVYAGFRLSPEGQQITRAQWWRIVFERAKEYETVTPALAQVCKTMTVGDALAKPSARRRLDSDAIEDATVLMW